MIVDDSGDRRFGVTGNLVMTTYMEQQQKAISALEQGRVIIDFQKLQELLN